VKFNDSVDRGAPILTTEGLSRRQALVGAAGAGLGLPLLAACGGSSNGQAGSPVASAPAAGVLAPTADIPVGGGAVFPDERVVVTQPREGEFKGFSAVCTHQGCLVSDVKDGVIECSCHFSRFSISDGSVEGGPAPSALPEVRLKVRRGEISIA
jgi:Rieske Fe-S protein